MKHSGDLTITQDNLWKYTELTEVSGSVYIKAANASLPALTEVTGYVFEQPSAKIAAARLVEVARRALATPKSLKMDYWHSCNTSHCIAGWAIHLAGEEGYTLERKVGPSNAGLVLLGVEAAGMFLLSDEEARSRLQKILVASDGAHR
jgi:hypothetical protein